MAKIYSRNGSKNLYASIMIWSEQEQKMIRDRVSTGTDNEEQALAFAEGLESAAKTAKALAGKTISREHADALFTNMLSTAGIRVEGDRPLPELRAFVKKFMEQKKRKITAGSIRGYTTSQNKFLAWLDCLNLAEEPRLDWLTDERVEDYYIWMRDFLAVKTSHDNIKWLSQVMNYALKKTKLAKNPCRLLEFDREGATLKRLPFSLDEARKIIDWLLTQGDRQREWARATMLSVMAGCRVKDAISMQIGQIIDGIVHYKDSKTQKDMVVPLVNEEWLEAILENKSGAICPILNAELQNWGNAKLSTEFTGYVSDAGVGQLYVEFKSGKRMARKTFHSLRHTLRTSIVLSGGSDAQADIILGHSEGQGKTYTHSEVEAMRSTLKKALQKRS